MQRVANDLGSLVKIYTFAAATTLLCAMPNECDPTEEDAGLR